MPHLPSLVKKANLNDPMLWVPHDHSGLELEKLCNNKFKWLHKYLKGYDQGCIFEKYFFAQKVP